MSNYGYTKKIDCDFLTAVERVREALPTEGFGILSEIDVKATLKKKLDKDVEDYLILGACNPNLASQALEVEKEIGLLLPCNVIVYREGEDVFISAMMPSVGMSFVENKALSKIAQKAEEKLKSVINNVS